MRPISLRFACFGPYVAEQFIDFEQLQKSGLFLISGETGSGKTTILDAMCYALYGKSSGGLRGNIEVMRCKLAKNDEPTYVEYIFETGGKRYKFTRRLEFGRKKLNDFHNCFVEENGVFVPIFENPKATFVNKRAEELIGLTDDQFRQVIILPQGQFEKLLVSNSADKEKILETLFHADHWGRIVKKVNERVNEKDAALKAEKLQISTKLGEYGCTTAEMLGQKAQEQREQLETLAAQVEESTALAAAARTAYEQGMLEDKDFRALTDRKQKLTNLQRQSDAMAREKIILEKAEEAEKLHPTYRASQEASQKQARCRRALDNARRQKDDAERERQSLYSQQKRLEDDREKYGKMKNELVLLESMRETYAAIPGFQKKASDAAAAKIAAQRRMGLAESAFDKADTRWITAQRLQNQAIREYQTAQEIYLRNIGSELAKELRDGQPCPVCGSVHHPNPAREAEGTVTQAQLKEKNEAMTRSSKAVTDTADDRTAAETKRKQEADALAEAVRVETTAAAELEHALSQRSLGIETLQQLEQQIAIRNRRTTEFEKAEQELQQKLNQAEANVMTAADQLVNALQEFDTAMQEAQAADELWQKVLAESALTDESEFLASDLKHEEKQRRQSVLMRWQAELETAAKAYEAMAQSLEGRTAPDMLSLQKNRDDAETLLKTLTGQQLLGRRKLETMEADRDSLAKREKAYNAARTKTDKLIEFASRLSGKSGISLQRYVLGVMLTATTVEANRQLEKVYGGRYRLFRTDAISGREHKGGLELEVYDSQNGQRRSVTTLSGGEKFLVALSLALGLSTVVQAQGHGIRLEAMFIDEGFGSLDRDAVLDALDVLRSIPASSGTVGIISHVDTLAEIIPTRLEITKGSRGSNCEICC